MIVGRGKERRSGERWGRVPRVCDVTWLPNERRLIEARRARGRGATARTQWVCI